MSSAPSTRKVGLQPDRADFEAVVIGAGFSGLYMLHKLRNELGLNVRLYEAGGGVGGTWYWNRYPGARTDSEFYVYCYIFDRELLQEWDWSNKFPLQTELLSYLEHVVDRFDLRRDIQLKTRIVRATYLEERNVWEVEDEHGNCNTTHFLITGLGLLASAPHHPKIEGIESFGGEVYHTGLWPREAVDLAGKRVAVIGTGSSGVQLSPVVAESAAQVYVLQRTPQFAVPARHQALTEEGRNVIKAHYDEILAEVKWSVLGWPYKTNGRSALTDTPGEREQTLRALWEAGGWQYMASSYDDVMTDRRANDFAAEFVRARIREIVEDPDVAEALLPVDHPIFGRRLVIESDYYAMFNRENVDLVDIRHWPIMAVTPTGIRTEGGDIDVDVIIFATGFDAVTGPFLRIDIRGRDGSQLREKWDDGALSYLGIGLSEFPNMLMITGPGSKFGNVPILIDLHVNWIGQCLAYMRSHGYVTIEATSQAETEWFAEVCRRAAGTLNELTEHAWARGGNIPGKKEGPLVFPGTLNEYRSILDRIGVDGYPGFQLS